MDECYGIIKAIAKKHPEKVRPLKERFINGFKYKLVTTENMNDDIALDYANRVWQIIEDNCGYGFNSAHAYCMALDSLYQAWQKAYYPYEFYEVNLQHFTDKGNKNKVALLKAEMFKAFGIKEGHYKFRHDNRSFVADKEKGVINPALASIKGISNTVAKNLYSLKDNEYNCFVDLLVDLKKIRIGSDKIETLIKINYFEEFGDINFLLYQKKLYDDYYERKELSKDCGIKTYILQKYAIKETAKKFAFGNMMPLIKELISNYDGRQVSIKTIMKHQLEYLGYIQYSDSRYKDDVYYVTEIDNNRVHLHNLSNGIDTVIKFRKGRQYKRDPFVAGDIIKIIRIEPEPKFIKGEDGEWTRDYNNYEDILQSWIIKSGGDK